MIFLLFPVFVSAEIISTPEPHDYKNGLLDDPYILKETTLPSNLYDNDLTSSLTLNGHSTRSYNVSFNEPVSLNSIYLNASIRSNTLTIITYFYNSSGILDNKEYVIRTSTKPYRYLDLDLKNVVSISINLKSESAYSSDFYEIDFFGSYGKEEIKIENIKDLSIFTTENDAILNYDLPTKFDEIEIHLNDKVYKTKNSTYTLEGLKSNTDYTVKIYTLLDGKKSSGISKKFKTLEEDISPPPNIFDLDYTVTSSSVDFTYSLPDDDNFSHLEIYRDMSKINEHHVLSSFQDTGLESEKQYFYTFKSVGKNGSISSGNTIGITTVEENDTTPPDTPKGLNASVGNSSISLSWHANNESDLAGYNIYVDGEKYNLSLIKGNTYVITNLNNNKDYDFQISAVDTSDNESEKSEVVTASPSVNELPILGMKYDLNDVAKSTSNWFSSLWLILAFSVAIPLSFYISNRVKSLFLT